MATVVLARACLQGDLSSATKALSRGAAVDDVSTRHGGSPLYLAAVKGNADVVALLLRRGAVVDRPNTNGITALWAAAAGGHLDVAKRLMDAGAQVNAFVVGVNDSAVELSQYCPNVMGMTPLFAAANGGHYALARGLSG